MDPESIVDFLRRGRGVSYHEVELPTGPVEQLAAVTSIAEYSGSNASPPACCTATGDAVATTGSWRASDHRCIPASSRNRWIWPYRRSNVKAFVEWMFLEAGGVKLDEGRQLFDRGHVVLLEQALGAVAGADALLDEEQASAEEIAQGPDLG